MLVAEYDYDTDIAIQRKESLMLGIQQGRSEGLQQGLTEEKSLGLAEGIEQGFADGVRHTAITLKQMGLEMRQIICATGLSETEIEAL